MPLGPEPSRTADGRREEERLRFEANRTLAALEALWTGDLSGAELGAASSLSASRASASWTAATASR
eukprot:3681318-Alexandrium_andersonii.AAC.1